MPEAKKQLLSSCPSLSFLDVHVLFLLRWPLLSTYREGLHVSHTGVSPPFELNICWGGGGKYSNNQIWLTSLLCSLTSHTDPETLS
jgi:hypothetical protein